MSQPKHAKNTQVVDELIQQLTQLLNEEKPPSINDLIRGKVEKVRKADHLTFLDKFIDPHKSKRRNKK